MFKRVRGYIEKIRETKNSEEKIKSNVWGIDLLGLVVSITVLLFLPKMKILWALDYLMLVVSVIAVRSIASQIYKRKCENNVWNFIKTIILLFSYFVSLIAVPFYFLIFALKSIGKYLEMKSLFYNLAAFIFEISIFLYGFFVCVGVSPQIQNELRFLFWIAFIAVFALFMRLISFLLVKNAIYYKKSTKYDYYLDAKRLKNYCLYFFVLCTTIGGFLLDISKYNISKMNVVISGAIFATFGQIALMQTKRTEKLTYILVILYKELTFFEESILPEINKPLYMNMKIKLSVEEYIIMSYKLIIPKSFSGLGKRYKQSFETALDKSIELLKNEYSFYNQTDIEKLQKDLNDTREAIAACLLKKA